MRVVDREVVDSEPIDVDGKARANDTDADADLDNDAKDNDPLSFLPLEGTAKQVVNWIAVFLGFWLLLNGVGMIAGGLPLDIAIPMLFGANIGTSVTSSLVALGLAGNRKQFHNGSSMATVHDFFNLIAICIFFTLEMITGFLGKTATAIAPALSGSDSGVISGIFESLGDFIDMITEPLVELASSLVEPLGDIWGGIVLAVVAAEGTKPVRKHKKINPNVTPEQQAELDEEIKLYGRPDGSGTLGVFK